MVAKGTQMKNRIFAIIALVLFLLILVNIFVIKFYEEISVIIYVLIIAVFLIFFNNKKADE
jgi:hypothetical protein